MVVRYDIDMVVEGSCELVEGVDRHLLDTSFLVNLLKERFYDIPLLEDWEADLEMFKIYELEYLPAEAVLYQAGYLTIKEVSDIDPNTVILSYPNEEVKRSFCRVMFWQGLEVPGSKKELQVNLQEPCGMSVLKR